MMVAALVVQRDAEQLGAYIGALLLHTSTFDPGGCCAERIRPYGPYLPYSPLSAETCAAVMRLRAETNKSKSTASRTGATKGQKRTVTRQPAECHAINAPSDMQAAQVAVESASDGEEHSDPGSDFESPTKEAPSPPKKSKAASAPNKKKAKTDVRPAVPCDVRPIVLGWGGLQTPSAPGSPNKKKKARTQAAARSV